ncbi:hypothetical protein CPB84DRAFT_1772470 [Gymnopilus junonius]|uniref:Uncharacterized protein n=1 Tax=Gymnopilus junonius TaxID=109634 RepID=A0A9P5NQF6_GYMJU|nr:hypothetical protein CPB84DRAFT_1772470 [Gymnopilus junonius]
MTPLRPTPTDNAFRTPSTTLDLTSPVNEKLGHNSGDRILNPHSKLNQLSNEQSLNSSRHPPRHSVTRSPLPSYDQTRPPGKTSSGPRSSIWSQQNKASTLSYDMVCSPEPTASSVVPSQPKGQQHFVPSAVSNLPTGKDVATRTEPSLSSQPITRTAAPQTAGTKRRLGMGRMTNSYSNKKFKHPV